MLTIEPLTKRAGEPCDGCRPLVVPAVAHVAASGIIVAYLCDACLKRHAVQAAGVAYGEAAALLLAPENAERLHAALRASDTES